MSSADSSLAESQKPNENQEQQQIKLKVTLQGRALVPLEVAPSDTLFEIKQYLHDSTILYFFSNYHFSLEGKTLNEYVDIASLNLLEDHTLDIKIDPFDEKSAKLHVKKVQEALSNHSILPSLFENQRASAEGEVPASKRNYRDSSDEEEIPEKVEKKVEGKKGQSQVENSSKQTNGHSEQNGKGKNSSITLNDAIQPTLANKILQKELSPKVLESQECLTFINYSGFNPPPHYRRIAGDLFYLNVKTLENMSYHVTSSPKGFFVNKCSSKTFDPEAAQSNLRFISLIDLLKHISPLFRDQFEKIVNSEAKIDQMNFPILSFFKYGNTWLSPKCNNEEHEWNMNRCEEFLVNLYGFDVNGPRDWNEELQIVRDLPRSDFISRLNRDKAQIKIQSEFVEAATEGAKAVVEKNIQPLNPMDPIHQQVYVYNQIFFSFALENSDHFKQETGPDASPNVTTANSDLRNLKLLHSLDIPGLSVLNTCLVDYKGHRVIAQSIIPGILNSDHSNCSQYGSIDEGKTISKNSEFEAIMRKICEHFHLDDEVKFFDEAKEEHTLCGSIEVKGIRGSDRRNYILDLMRLSPRDVNYADSTNHQCCTLRHELISNYALSKQFEEADKALKEADKTDVKSEEETQEEKNKRGLSRFLKIKEYMSNPENQIKLKLNPNICTKAPLVEVPQLKEQHLQLMDLSNYLLNKAIPNLISDLIVNSEHGRISDSRSIEKYFHQNGVNMRYLGKVLSQINKKDHPHIYMIIERVILVKAMKHVFREIMRDTSDVFVVAAIARALNCVFASPETRTKIEKGEIDGVIAAAGDSLANGGDSKKKKKDKKKNSKAATANKSLGSLKAADDTVIHTLSAIDLDLPATLQIKPSQLWAKVSHVALSRYTHTFPENINDFNDLNLKFNRLATLRDLLLSIGVQIESFDYEFQQESSAINIASDKGSKGSQSSTAANQSSALNAGKSQLPFAPENIKGITPIVKYIQINSEDSKANIEMGEKSMSEGKANEALEYFNTASHILINLFGPVHKDHAYCQIKISNIYFKIRDFEHAIHYQKQAIAIYKRLYGLDHHSTAQAISTLAYFYFSIKKYSLAYKNMFKTLFIYSLIGGESHPDCFNTFMNLSLMFQENEQHQASLSCLFEVLDRSITVFGKNHIKIAGCYQAVALAHYDITDIKKAIEYQQKCISILKQNLEADDSRLKEALLFQQKFERTLSEKKKAPNQNSLI